MNVWFVILSAFMVSTFMADALMLVRSHGIQHILIIAIMYFSSEH